MPNVILCDPQGNIVLSLSSVSEHTSNGDKIFHEIRRYFIDYDWKLAEELIQKGSYAEAIARLKSSPPLRYKWGDPDVHRSPRFQGYMLYRSHMALKQWAEALKAIDQVAAEHNGRCRSCQTAVAALQLPKYLHARNGQGC